MIGNTLGFEKASGKCNEIQDLLKAKDEKYCRVTPLSRCREFKWAKTAAGKFN